MLLYFNDGVDYIKFFRILYFAQKEYLVKYGRGVIGDVFHALKYSPVLSFIYNSLFKVTLDERDEVTPKGGIHFVLNTLKLLKMLVMVTM